MNDLRRIVVCGATGRLGGAVLNALHQSGKWNIIGLSRNVNGARAKIIKKKGVKVLPADLVDKDSLLNAFKGAYGVFGVTYPMNLKGKIDTGIELEQGKNIIEACAEANIRHLVLSTVIVHKEGQETTLGYVKSKAMLEKYTDEKGVPNTILRPATFFDEIGGEFMPLKKGVYTGMLDADCKMLHLACHDFGKIAAIVFDQPEKWIGKKQNLAGDFISGNEMVTLLNELYPKIKFKYRVPPLLLMHLFARVWIPLRKHLENWGRPPYPESIEQTLQETRDILPETMDTLDYLHFSGWDVKFY
jgi:uncharacterized protein YbjT (DUF2867 family)